MAKGITFDLIKNADGSIRGVTFTDIRHNITFAGSKIDHSLSFAKIDGQLLNIVYYDAHQDEEPIMHQQEQDKPFDINEAYAIDAEQFGKLVPTVMGDYLKAHQDKNAVDREKSTAKQVEDVLEKYKAALLLLLKERQTSQGGSSQNQPSPIHKGVVVPAGITKPEKPTRRKDLFGYWLYRLPWYQIWTLFASRYFRWWLCTILFCIWLTSIFLTCIIAYDNAKLRPVQEKYVLLREFARPNQEWAEKAEYIEYLYSDEEEHKKEIEDLWDQRRKRMGH